MHLGDRSALDLGIGLTPASCGHEAFDIVAATTRRPILASIIPVTAKLQ